MTVKQMLFLALVIVVSILLANWLTEWMKATKAKKIAAAALAAAQAANQPTTTEG